MNEIDLLQKEFNEWANHPTTIKVRNLLIRERSQYDSIDESYASKLIHSDKIEPLENIGIDTLMRACIVKGIDVFTNFDDLYDGYIESYGGDTDV